MKLRKNMPGISLTPTQVQYGALLVTGLMEMALIVHRATERVETYMIVPALVFLGATLVSDKSRTARRSLAVGIVCVLWFCLVQEIHRSTEGATRSLGLFATAYLLAFPFASVCPDKRGVRDFGYMYLVAALAVCAGSLALVLKILPESLATDFHWDGTRLYATSYPTIMACPLMIAIAFCLAQIYRVKTWWGKAVYFLLMVIMLAVQALTNDRTAILLTDALIGGSVFLAQLGKGWKRVLLGLLAAVLLLVGLYAAATMLYNANTAALQKDFYAQQSAAAEEVSTDEQETAPEEGVATDQEVQLPEDEIVPAQEEPAQVEETTQPAVFPDNGERSLLADLGTLNGRTITWKQAIAALKANPRILLFGVHDVPAAVADWDPLIEHTHNSFLEILFWLGIPGLVMALYFAFLALKAGLRVLFGAAPMYRKCAALLCLCLLANGMLEPLLFTGSSYYHFLNVFFFLCLGYVNQWVSEVPGRKSAGRLSQ